MTPGHFPPVSATPTFVQQVERLAEELRGYRGDAVVIVRDSQRQMEASGRTVLFRAPSPEMALAARAVAVSGIPVCVVVDQSLGGRGGRHVVSDHINLTGENPLVGPNHAEWGVRFPDMTEPYSTRLRAAMRAIGPEIVVVGVPEGDVVPPSPPIGAEERCSGLIHAAIAAVHGGVEVGAAVTDRSEDLLPLARDIATILNGG